MMAISKNWDNLDVTQQNTEKIVIQDWLNGNNFSQASHGFEPLIVQADVHYAASGATKPSQSDIDEDFFSVSQVFARKKLLKPIKKKRKIDAGNLDAIESYEENESKRKKYDGNNKFDKIFHNGKKMIHEIERTYPGKTRNRLRKKKEILPIYNDLFISNSNESNRTNHSKVDFSSGSGDVWTPTQHKSNVFKKKILSNKRLLSQHICKKYLKNKSQRLIDKAKIVNRIDKNLVRKRSNKNIKKNKIDILTTLESDKSNTNFDKCSFVERNLRVSAEKEDCCDLKFENSKTYTYLTNNNLAHEQDFTNNHCKSNVPTVEFEQSLKNVPIVLAEKLDAYKVQQTVKEKNAETAINLTKNSLEIGSYKPKRKINFVQSNQLLMDENWHLHTNIKEDIIENGVSKIEVENLDKSSEKLPLNPNNSVLTDPCELRNHPKNNTVKQSLFSKIKRKIRIPKSNLNCNNEQNKIVTKANIFKKVPIVLVRPLKISKPHLEYIDNNVEETCKVDISNKNIDIKKTIHMDTSNKPLEPYDKICHHRNKFLVTPIKVKDQKSPGWSKLENTIKDFNTSQKNRLNVSINSTVKKTDILNLNTSCQDVNEHRYETSDVNREGKKVVRNLFHKETQEAILDVNMCKHNDRSDIQQDINKIVDGFNGINKLSVPNIDVFLCKILKENNNQNMNMESTANKTESLKSNSNNKKSAIILEDGIGQSTKQNTTESAQLGSPNEEQKVSRSTLKTINPLINVGVQTCPNIYLNYCLHLLRNSCKIEKDNLSRTEISQNSLLFGSDILTSTVDVSLLECSNTKNLESKFCKRILNLQDKIISSSGYDICTDETYFESCQNFGNTTIINNSKKSNCEITEKVDVFSRDLFSNSYNCSSSGRQITQCCLNHSFKSNAFFDTILFTGVSSVGRVSFDFSANSKHSESIFKNNISSNCRKNIDISGISKLKDSTNKDSVEAKHNSSELQNICSSSSKCLDTVLAPRESNMDFPLQSSDFIIGTPEACITRNNNMVIGHSSTSSQTEDFPLYNESLMSLSTVKLDEVNSPNFDTAPGYDIIVSDFSMERNTSSESTNEIYSNEEVTNTNIIDLVNKSSVLVHEMDEFTNEVVSNHTKEMSWSRIPSNSEIDLPNTINTSMLTEVLDTQQQKLLGDECKHLEAQIQAIEEEINKKAQH